MVTLIDFSGQTLKLDEKKDSEQIVQALRQNPEATCLNLSGNTLGITAAEPIGIALEHNPMLQRCLWSDLFTGRLKSEIAPALRHLSSGIMASGAHLVELDLSDNAFGPNGVIGVVDLIGSPACSTLQILRMNNQGLGHEGCRHLADALQKGRKTSGGRGLLLKVFSAGRNRLENFGAELLSEVLSDMGSLEEVSLYQNGIGIHGIEGVKALVRMMKSNPKLRVLNLSDNSLTPKGGKAIAKALRSLQNLEELHLSDCILRPSGVAALASALEDPDILPNLRVLNLPGNEITRNTGISLVLALGNKPKLERLDLNANEFGKSGIRAIIRTLDSVGLLHVLSVSQSSPQLGTEPVGDGINDPFTAAFDEDQGSGDEEDSDAEANYSEEPDLGGSGYDDNGTDGYDDYEAEQEDPSDDDKEASFNTVEERPIIKPNSGFSFRALEAAMGDVCSPTTTSEAKPAAKAGPFDLGLFSALGRSSTDATDAASMRSKLWPTNSPMMSSTLFTSSSNTGITFGKGHHLFSPPILSVPGSSSNNQHLNGSEAGSATKFGTKPLDQEGSVLAQLNHCLTNRKQSKHVDQLIDTVSNVNSTELPLNQIQSATQTAEPEDVVRLGLHLCRLASSIDTTKGNRIQRFVVDLLASVLLPKEFHSDPTKYRESTDTTDNGPSRAANCLLVHLGAIKAEKFSEDYEEVKQLDASAWEQRRFTYLSALRQLVDYHGNSIRSEPAWNSIRFLLAQQSEKRREHSGPTQGPAQSDALCDDLVTLLESRMSRVQIA